MSTTALAVATPAAPLAAPALHRSPLPPEQNPAALYFMGRQKPSSKVTARASLEAAAKLWGVEAVDVPRFAWERLRYPQITALRDRLIQEQYAPRTTNRILGAVRGVLHEAWRLEFLTDREWAMVQEVTGLPIDEDEASGRALDVSEIQALLRACETNTFRGERDRMIVTVAIYAGPRRFELAKMQNEDFDQKTQKLRIKGKGDKTRFVPVAPIGAVRLGAWCRTIGPGPMFPKSLGSTTPLAEVTLVSRLLRLGRVAGIKHFSPHDLRRTFVTSIVRQTGDLHFAQGLAGHKRIDTTKKYDRRAQEEMHAKVQGLVFE